METLEYKVVCKTTDSTYLDDHEKSLEEELNQLAKESWELVSTELGSNRLGHTVVTFFLKRKARQAKEPLPQPRLARGPH